MPLPELAMSDAFRVEWTPRSGVVAGLRRAPAGRRSRGQAQMFWGLGLVWLVASTAVAAGLLQRTGGSTALAPPP